MIIDFNKIAQAEFYYFEMGYEKVSVPWIVSNEPYQATKPERAGRDFVTLDGNLIASGEQGFLQMMIDGLEVRKAQCTTPCFRDEVHDEWHFPYFMKTELINTQVSDGNLENMIEVASAFFSKFTIVKVVQIGENMFDIVDAKLNVELGSYGIREFKKFKWIYGTGLAEPRLSQVLGKLAWW